MKHSAPDWAKEAIFYQIVPERFANGDISNDPDNTEPWGGQPTNDNFFGGDLLWMALCILSWMHLVTAFCTVNLPSRVKSL
jgi:hypothetical protein